jgi:transcriptional regulator with XRE-family HTH domain
MLINMRTSATAGIELLRQERIDVVLLDAKRVLLDGRPAALFVRQNVPSPSELMQAKGLYVLPRISAGLRALAAQNHEITISAPNVQEILYRGERLHNLRPAELPPAPMGKVNWTRFGLLRSLARTAKPRTQMELAGELGITQGAVSQNLANLSHLVKKTSMGWSAGSFELIAKEFLENYPGPGGVERSWFGLDAVIPQGEKALRAFPGSLLSADSAADELSPYRRARTAMIYTTSSLDLQSLGFASSPREKATLIEITPDDQTIFPLAKANSSKPLVDGLLVAYDLRRSLGPDRDAAAAELLIDLEKNWAKDDF